MGGLQGQISFLSVGFREIKGHKSRKSKTGDINKHLLIPYAFLKHLITYYSFVLALQSAAQDKYTYSGRTRFKFEAHYSGIPLHL